MEVYWGAGAYEFPAGKQVSRTLLPAWVCDICGFRWLVNKAEDGTEIIPVQCPSSKCRSRHWNKAGELSEARGRG